MIYNQWELDTLKILNKYRTIYDVYAAREGGWIKVLSTSKREFANKIVANLLRNNWFATIKEI